MLVSFFRRTVVTWLVIFTSCLMVNLAATAEPPATHSFTIYFLNRTDKDLFFTDGKMNTALFGGQIFNIDPFTLCPMILSSARVELAVGVAIKNIVWRLDRRYTCNNKKGCQHLLIEVTEAKKSNNYILRTFPDADIEAILREIEAHKRAREELRAAEAAGPDTEIAEELVAACATGGDGEARRLLEAGVPAAAAAVGAGAIPLAVKPAIEESVEEKEEEGYVLVSAGTRMVFNVV